MTTKREVLFYTHTNEVDKEMNTQQVINKLSKAKENYAALVASITLDDQINGNQVKESAIDLAMGEIERLQMTLSVRQQAAEIER